MTGSVAGTNEIPGPPINFTLFPNPAKDVIHLQSSYTFSTGDMLTVSDRKGSLVLQKELSGNETVDLNLSGLSEGTYYCQITNRYGITIFKSKFVVIGVQ